MEEVKEILQDVVEEIDDITTILDEEDSVILEDVPDEVVIEEVVDVSGEEKEED